MVRIRFILCVGLWCSVSALLGQGTQPLVAIHDSELTRALESMPASGATPTGSGTTSNQWWTTHWRYVVMPESVKEALRSDGTAFTVVGDSNITAGVLVTNSVPRYPIVISLASEAIDNTEITQLTNYVARGGFLLVGSSAFTRNTNGTTRGDFAFGNAMGVHMVVPGLTNWTVNSTNTKTTIHRLVSDMPSGPLIWRMPSYSEEISWGISPSHPFLAPHDLWKVQVDSGAVVVTTGDSYPFLVVKPFGKGYFIYHAALQPLIGHGGWAPGMYAYMIFRRAIEWAFESANLPIPKLSPWPYPYDAALMVRHDMENYTNAIAAIEASAGVEYTNGVKGDYYFCTGTVRDDAPNKTTIITGLRRAVTNYNATIGPHNGWSKNPNNPSLVRGQYDYWHWGPDEALDVGGGKTYAFTSISNSFKDIEGWLSGTGNGSGLRTWVSPYFNATREDSYDIQASLNVKITGDQKLTPFPHWTVSTKTADKRYALLSEPVSDWFVGGLVAQSLEPWHPPGVHNSETMHSAVDFYYNLGALINIYSHTLSTGLGDAGPLVADYITYSMNTNLHPRVWAANGVGVYQWWLQRSNAQINATFATNGNQLIATVSIQGATHTNTAIEIVVPGTNALCNIQVLTNGIPAGANTYQTNGQMIRVKVGTGVTNAVVSYYLLKPGSQVFSENCDGVTAPALPAGWSTSASGAQGNWVTQTPVRDTAPNAAFSSAATNVGINELISAPTTLPAGISQLSFRHNYNLESSSGGVGYDGGVLEIKIGTNAYADVVSAGGTFVAGGYNRRISGLYSNALGGRLAWSGSSGGFISTLLNLPASASGQTIQLRWRCATDNGTNSGIGVGWYIDTIGVTTQVCSCCGSTNTPPVLPTQPDRTITELTSLAVTNTATDVDIPVQTLNYELLSAPDGALIDTSGVITWTPAEEQGPGTYTLTTRVTDNGFPALSATNSFTVVVNEINSAPTLPGQTNRTILELTTLTVTYTASDSDVPANTLTYTLLAAPSGAGITNGVITWTPTEAQGPTTNTFTTRVVDDGVPALSATNSFTVVVSESNSPPVLPAQANRTVGTLTTLTVTNTATDPDLPANTLTYTLLVGPTNAAINTNTGVITWTPTEAQNGTTNVMRTVVTDYNPAAVNAQKLSATNSFTVVVLSGPLVVLDAATVIGEGFVPTNNAVDPGETVTLLLALKNVGVANTTNLVATVLPTNGVVSPSAPQAYGALPAGGAAVSQAFTFTASGTCGGSITPTLQLQDGPTNYGMVAVSLTMGQLGTVLTQNFDTVTVPALPSGWTTSATNAQSPWFTTNSLSDTTPNAAFSASANSVGVNELVSPPILLSLGEAQLSFRHSYSFEADAQHATNGFDGGVLEIKIGTNSYTDITNSGGTWVANGYNRRIDTGFENPLAGRWAWSGTNGGYVTTTVTLPPAAAGQTIQLRWRCGTDAGGVSGSGWRVDTIALTSQVCSCCGSTNTPPVLPAQPNRTIAELTSLAVTNTATDADIPVQTLNYELLSAPGGALIDTSGVITWTPTEAQGPGTYTLTTRVTDNGSPALSATNSFTVVVNETNSVPTLPGQTNRTILELTTLTVTYTASDSDVPANTLTYTLLAAPSGAGITNGVITWTPTEAQGPTTNTFTTRVVDDGVPALSATNSFTVVVQESNSPPVLPAQANRTVGTLTTLTVTNTATDPDLPANTLTYTLLVGPTNAAINTNTGVITWTPTEAQNGTTNVMTTVVTDYNPAAVNTQRLSTTNSFTVVVLSGPVVLLDAATLVGEGFMPTNNAADPGETVTLLFALKNVGEGNTANLVATLLATNGVVGPSGAQSYGALVVGGGAVSQPFTFTASGTCGGTITPTLQLQDGAVNLGTVATSFTLGQPGTILTQNFDGVTVPALPSGWTTAGSNALPGWVSTNSLSDTTPNAAFSPDVGSVGLNELVSPAILLPLGPAQLSFRNRYDLEYDPDHLTNGWDGGVLEIKIGTNAFTDILTAGGTFTSGGYNTTIDTLYGSPLAGRRAWSGNSGGYLTTLVNLPTAAAGQTIQLRWRCATDEGNGGSGWRIDSVAINGPGCTVNNPPTLPTQPNRTINELTSLTVTNTASDPESPPEVLAYALAVAPTNAVISTNGVITWTPDRGPGPGPLHLHDRGDRQRGTVGQRHQQLHRHGQRGERGARPHRARHPDDQRHRRSGLPTPRRRIPTCRSTP